MTALVLLFLRLFALMTLSCNEISSLQLLIIPEGTINGLNFSLECKANNITADINIKAPSGNVVTCNPTTQHVDASCPDPQYTINEETNTVSMTKEAANVDQGEWTCTHTTVPLESASQSITVNILQPLPNGNLTKNTTAEPSEIINTLTGDTFTVFYGCFSSTVKFKWTISSIDWIANGKLSTAMPCPDNTTGYMNTQTVSDIWMNLKTDVNEMLFVTILTTDDYVIHPSSSFDQIFFKSKASESSKKLSAGEVAGIAIGSVGVLGCGLGIVLAYKAIKGPKEKSHI